MMPPLHVLKSMATQSGGAPAGCCVSSPVFSFTSLAVVASWDVHGSEAGYTLANYQVDQHNMLLYAHMQRVNPSPQLEAFEVWLTPGAVQGQWFDFVKFHNSPDCYVRNLTVKPDIFMPICWGPPYTPFEYKGDVTIGTHTVSIWDEVTGHNYNETHFIQMDACLPTFQLGFGINGASDWQERLSNVVNIVYKINDPSKFIPPTQCKPMAAMPERLMNAVESNRATRRFFA